MRPPHQRLRVVRIQLDRPRIGDARLRHFATAGHPLGRLGSHRLRGRLHERRYDRFRGGDFRGSHFRGREKGLPLLDEVSQDLRTLSQRQPVGVLAGGRVHGAHAHPRGEARLQHARPLRPGRPPGLVAVHEQHYLPQVLQSFECGQVLARQPARAVQREHRPLGVQAHRGRVDDALAEHDALRACCRVARVQPPPPLRVVVTPAVARRG